MSAVNVYQSNYEQTNEKKKINRNPAKSKKNGKYKQNIEMKAKGEEEQTNKIKMKKKNIETFAAQNDWVCFPYSFWVAFEN